MADAGIVRNRAKVDAAIVNARATVALRDGEGLLRSSSDTGPTPRPRPRAPPATCSPRPPESIALSKTLKKAGFAFVGPTTMHALMEALGIVDDHLVGCHRRGVRRLTRDPMYLRPHGALLRGAAGRRGSTASLWERLGVTTRRPPAHTGGRRQVCGR